MRNTVVSLLAAVALSGLTGCEVVGPRVKVEPPKVKVPVVVIEGQDQGKHCPPGQAKKGRC
ncbi:hypothetical protein ACFO3I_08445 [Rheinheimera marina]|uniref:Vir-repressed protein n=1 Tax=Rheinheimera marina TaxID=1774958 RepID=A0ABV9JLB9_9GAMM